MQQLFAAHRATPHGFFHHRSLSRSILAKTWLRVAVVVGTLAACTWCPSARADEKLSPSGISAVWANDGGDKVTQSELRGSAAVPKVVNAVWNRRGITLFGARNEVIGFNVIIEAAERTATDIEVRFDELKGPDGTTIRSASAPKDGVFEWAHRPIELFFLRYLQIRGLSLTSYDTYDERHIPARLERPMIDGAYRGGWIDRPDHDQFYPDIAVPLELVGPFAIESKHNQSVWIDIYIPKGVPPGRYLGRIAILEGGVERRKVPVTLDVRDFALPDIPTAKTMIATDYADVARRYTGIKYPNPGSQQDRLTRLVLDRQMLLAHRHKLSLIDANGGAASWPRDEPRPYWIPWLDGSLFTKAHGYSGPGEATGNGVFSIGTYGHWSELWGPSKQAVWQHTDRWESWFLGHFPNVERFVYLADESPDYPQLQTWASWIRENPGVGRRMKSFATVNLLRAQASIPALDVVASTIAVGDRSSWETASAQITASEGKAFYLYNGSRPASGSFAIEDDGVALRELAWGQYKKKIARWFAWEATYYDDYQGGRGENDVFHNAQVFGGPVAENKLSGRIGWNSSNGDGLLFYPGTDRIYPASSYELEGPIASLRLKLWRRGIQDVDYLALADAVDPAAVRAIIDRMVPSVLWENGVSEPKDPTWATCPIGWSINPDDWEHAREQLADIIKRRPKS
jgi:hypothetical protein